MVVRLQALIKHLNAIQVMVGIGGRTFSFMQSIQGVTKVWYRSNNSDWKEREWGRGCSLGDYFEFSKGNPWFFLLKI